MNTKLLITTSVFTLVALFTATVAAAERDSSWTSTHQSAGSQTASPSTPTPPPPLSSSDTTKPDAARHTNLTRVLVTGDALVQAQPDTAILIIAVVTQNPRALVAQQENARKSLEVVRAVKAAVGEGPSVEVKTSGYSLQPQRVYKEAQPPRIVGYEARNGVTVTISDLTKIGAVIDVASQAGANSVDNLSFTLRNDQPARGQALAEATREALSKAQVIAQALGGRVVRVAEVQEEGTIRRPPVPYEDMQLRVPAKVAAPTPVEVGSLDISSQVQLTVEIAVTP